MLDLGLRRRLRDSARDPAFRNRIVAPIASDGLTLAINLFTGVLVARLLGTDGRGEIAATLAIAQMFGWLFSAGVSQAASYTLAQRPETGRSFLNSWLVVLLPLALLAVLLAELLLPTLFGAQSDAAYDTARLYLLMIAGYVILELPYGVLSGSHDFLAFNALRVLQPLLIASGYVGLWISGEMTVGSALIVNAIALAATLAIGLARAYARSVPGRPSLRLAKETAAFGLRAHVSAAGGFMVARLDVMIIPAFLSASAVGLYSVATNVASMLLTLTGALAILVLPAAARERRRAVPTVVRSALITFCITGCLAVILGVAAESLLSLVYGQPFRDAGASLRILLPGLVLGAVGTVIRSGLMAAGRPLTAAATNAVGVAITVAGLIVVLPDGGIEGAAIVSTIAFAASFITAVVMFKRVERVSWSQLLKAGRGAL